MLMYTLAWLCGVVTAYAGIYGFPEDVDGWWRTKKFHLSIAGLNAAVRRFAPVAGREPRVSLQPASLTAS
jgi:hypothetical protein